MEQNVNITGFQPQIVTGFMFYPIYLLDFVTADHSLSPFSWINQLTIRRTVMISQQNLFMKFTS